MYESSNFFCHLGAVPFSMRSRMFELLPGTAKDSGNKNFGQYVFAEVSAGHNVNLDFDFSARYYVPQLSPRYWHGVMVAGHD